MAFDMLATMDGNNSLKRAERRKDDSGQVVLVRNIELDEGKDFKDPMYLPEDLVNRYKNEVKGHADTSEEPMPGDGDTPTPCTDTWKNLAADSTKRAAKYFRETGIFIAVCRHGNCLAICDMVRSGEL